MKRRIFSVLLSSALLHDGARRLRARGAKQIQAEARPTQRVKPLRGTS